jgi:hypothetical protein
LVSTLSSPRIASTLLTNTDEPPVGGPLTRQSIKRRVGGHRLRTSAAIRS